ncbi:MAG: cation transporter [Propionibacteriaceae bacterium]|jgi:copper chaperone CopZ|nr:cation transporter [Propionibacteriaceae bacterium]
MVTTYTVTGMTCGHCVAAVKSEVGEIPGVTDVELELAGELKVHSDAPVGFSDIAAAVAQAGDYTVTT